jgi:hypothetical protein
MRRRLPMLDLETQDRASNFFRHQGCATHIRVGQYDDKFLAAIPRGVIAGLSRHAVNIRRHSRRSCSAAWWRYCSSPIR